MSVSVARGLRAIPRAVSVAAVSSLLVAAPAMGGGGGGETYNNVGIKLVGGDVTAVSECINRARTRARLDTHHDRTGKGKRGGKVVQKNYCKNIAVAKGGDVVMRNVDIEIVQPDGSKKRVNNVTINLRGGDVNAFASCVNYAKGTATAEQTNVCKNDATAIGGDVVLENVSIYIEQY